MDCCISNLAKAGIKHEPMKASNCMPDRWVLRESQDATYQESTCAATLILPHKRM